MITKKTKSNRAAKTPNAAHALVEFKLTEPKAMEVSIVGAFNGWDPSCTPLQNDGTGVWRVLLPLATGQHEYLYVVDGQWQEDPTAKQFSTNPFGGHNSVVKVAAEPRANAA